METINNKELRDESIFPSDEILQRVLGKSFAHYRELLDLFEKNGMLWEWRYYRDGKAWLCKVQKKGRTIVWMSAWKGYMQATVYLPEKLIRGVYKLKVSQQAKDTIRKTTNVGTSKPCIFKIRSRRALQDIDKVMQYKIETK